MKTTPFETTTNNQENLSKDQWQKKLELAKNKREQILAQSSEFYDQELYDLYVSTALHFGADSDAQILYINSGGNDYQTVRKNYKKFENFRNEQLAPVEKEIETINTEIFKIRNKEASDKNRQTEIEEEEKFQTEKNELIDALYGELNSIYDQIPKEADEVGMKTEISLKTYLPELVGRARRIEGYIKRAEDIRIPYDMRNIKINLADDDIFKK